MQKYVMIEGINWSVFPYWMGWEDGERVVGFMSFHLDFGVWNRIFPVPAAVVDRGLAGVDGDKLKVLLYYLRHAGEEVDLDQASRQLGCTKQQISDSLHYWEGAGIIDLGQDTGPDGEQAGKTQEQPEPPFPKHKLTPSRTVPKTMAADVARRTKESEEIRFLLSQAENCLKKMLSSGEISTLVGLYDWAGMRVEVILMVLEYCISLGKTNMRYIERTALDWANNGIDTHEKAEAYIQKTTQRNQQEALVKSAFGIYDRSLVEREREYIRTWFEEYGFSISMVKLAYERAVERTGKLSFPYVNSILRSWYEKGVTTPKQAQEERKPEESSSPPSTSMDLEEFGRMGLLHTPKLE